MKNIDFFPCSEAQNRTRKIKILGKELSVKNYICSPDGLHYRKKPEDVRLRLSICPTTYCPASCPFCIAKNTKQRTTLDLGKLERVLSALYSEGVILCIDFTGGEPFCEIELLNQAVSLVFQIFGYGMQVSISTNGLGLKNLDKIKELERVDTIHVSRHHYDDAVNDAIFGIPMPTSAQLRTYVHSVPYRDIFVMNCMLLKDYIHTPQDAERMLDYAIEMGIPKVSFITCTPVNAYTEAQRIEYDAVLQDGNASLLFTRGYRDFDYCHCRDGVYLSPQGELEEFYGRTSLPDGCNYCRGLVYGADNHLRSGFSGEIIA